MNNFVFDGVADENFESILPNNLRKQKRFVSYTKSKLPINSLTGKAANITEQENWSSFKNAVIACIKYKHVAGIGFVLGKSALGNLCGLDIDNCIDEDGNISKEAQEIINILDTYTEISPSGKGIHCIFFAKKNGNLCKNNKLSWCKSLEIYDKDRYFTLTSKTINCKDVEYRQDECNQIYQKYFKTKEKLKTTDSTNNYKDANQSLSYGLIKDKKLKNCWSGARLCEDESRNDMAFMSRLMYWCNNNIEIAIDAFKSSPYAQNKDESHKRKLERNDYLRRTAEKCVHNCGDANNE